MRKEPPKNISLGVASPLGDMPRREGMTIEITAKELKTIREIEKKHQEFPAHEPYWYLLCYAVVQLLKDKGVLYVDNKEM